MLQVCKPDSVLPPKRNGYHLSVQKVALMNRSAYPSCHPAVSGIVNEQPTFKKAGFTWHFSIQGLPVFSITNKHRELLPHVFTLMAPMAPQLFSVALSSPVLNGVRLFTGVLLCAVRTFLIPIKREAITRLVTLQI